MIQTGTRTTYNDTVGVRTDIENALPLLVDPFDIPLYLRFGTKPPTVNSFKHEWQEEDLMPSQDDLNEDLDGTETGVDVTDGTKFKAGYLIQLGSSGEKMRVVSVSSNTLTVNRGYAGTTAAIVTKANCNAAGGIKIIGQVAGDGDDPKTFSTTDRTPKFNYHQTWQEAITISEQDEWQQVFGIGDKFSHEVDKWLKVLGVRRAYALINGSRYEDVTNKARLMGGLNFFITTNATDAGAVDFDEDVANAQLRLIYRAGGRADLIAVSDVQKSKVSALISAAQREFNRPTADETVGAAANFYQSDFGRQELLMDRQVDADRAYYLSTPLIKKVKGMPLTLENLSKTGSARKSQILGWESLEVKAEEHHAISTNLATT